MDPDLRADCASCAGLCCVAPAFAASSDFAIDKPAGHACPNLASDFRCGIHSELRERGFPGCTVFDCFGAGQQVTQVTFGGRDWRSAPEIAKPMFAAFDVVRQLHELLWYLADAASRDDAQALHAELARARKRTEQLARSSPDELAGLDMAAYRQEINVLLLRTSDLVRADPERTAVQGGRDQPSGRRSSGRRSTGRHRPEQVGRAADLAGQDLRGADLIGRDLRDADLRGASLRGAYLIGADLRSADLRSADVIGADFRAADLSGANLTGCLFLTQFQVNAARGDGTTRIPDAVTRPAHWTPRRSAEP